STCAWRGLRKENPAMAEDRADDVLAFRKVGVDSSEGCGDLGSVPLKGRRPWTTWTAGVSARVIGSGSSPVKGSARPANTVHDRVPGRLLDRVLRSDASMPMTGLAGLRPLNI